MRMNKEELEKLKDFKVYAFEWDVYVKAEDYKKIAIENKKLKEELEKKNELLSNAARCAEQYRGKMISIMNELKMSLYKD